MAQPGGTPPGGPLLTVCRWAFQAACWLSSACQLRFMALIMAQVAGPLLDAAAVGPLLDTILPEGGTTQALLAATGSASMALYGIALYTEMYEAIPFYRVALRMAAAIMEGAGELIAADRHVWNAGIMQLPKCSLCSGVVASETMATHLCTPH